MKYIHVSLGQTDKPQRLALQKHKYERPQKSNPHELTIRQHIIPVKSIERFYNEKGQIQLLDRKDNSVKDTAAGCYFFIAQRVWDECAEKGWMKCIEDKFQSLLDKILAGKGFLDGDDSNIVNEYFYLWFFRSSVVPESGHVELSGVKGEIISLHDQEKYEKFGAAFYLSEGVPERFLVGDAIQMKLLGACQRAKRAGSYWSIIKTIDGEFIHPDCPSIPVIPLAPRIALIERNQHGFIMREQVEEINLRQLEGAKDFVFAQRLDHALSFKGMSLL